MTSKEKLITIKDILARYKIVNDQLYYNWDYYDDPKEACYDWISTVFQVGHHVRVGKEGKFIRILHYNSRDWMEVKINDLCCNPKSIINDLLLCESFFISTEKDKQSRVLEYINLQIAIQYLEKEPRSKITKKGVKQ